MAWRLGDKKAWAVWRRRSANAMHRSSALVHRMSAVHWAFSREISPPSMALCCSLGARLAWGWHLVRAFRQQLRHSKRSGTGERSGVAHGVRGVFAACCQTRSRPADAMAATSAPLLRRHRRRLRPRPPPPFTSSSVAAIASAAVASANAVALRTAFVAFGSVLAGRSHPANARSASLPPFAASPPPTAHLVRHRLRQLLRRGDRSGTDKGSGLAELG